MARQSIKNDKMMSAYMSEFVSFNVLDADYLEAKAKAATEEEAEEARSLDITDITITSKVREDMREP